MSCRYEMWDGAYVLGSLSPADRREFEEHLDWCEECSRAVRDLAGLPGLLGRIGPDVIEAGPVEPVPETLRPRLFRAVRRQRQRRTWLTAGIAAAAAAAITIGGAVVLDHGNKSADNTADNTTPSVVVSTAPPQAMTRIGNDPMTAEISLTRVAWGTRLDLTCSYPEAFGLYESGRYALVVHTKDGRSHQVATWRGLPGRAMHLSAATASPKSMIKSVAITTGAGTPVLRLQL
jgi:hypothetical protein